MEHILDLDSAFSEAAEAVREFVNIDTSTMLRLYGLYKQSTEGVCNIPKPSMFNFAARQKWEAWNSLGTVSSNESKHQYVELVHSLAANQTQGTESVKKISTFGVSVSCMAKTDQEIADCDKTIFDWLKEGSVSKVATMMEANSSLINIRDENDMGLIHWAADRGDTSMIEYLAKNGSSVDITDADGQTPLHYAFACGHEDCIHLLETLGADRNVRDHNGMLPSDLSNS